MLRLKERNRFRQAVCVAVLASSLCVFMAVDAHSQSFGSLRVSFINVGQGDSALLQDPSGFDVLIDGGVASQGPGVVQYLKGAGIDDIDVMVASHADADHIGGLTGVLQSNEIPVEAVVYNGYAGTTNTWNNFINAVANKGLVPTVAQYPQTFVWGGMTAHVLNPEGGLSSPETNDASLVLRIDYGEFSLLFTGDIDSAVEAQVEARGTPLASDVLKVAHHGSAYSSSDAFLAAANPSDSLISVGINSYGHPNNGAVQRIMASGSTVWRTDISGNVVIESDGVTYTLSPQFAEFEFLPFMMQVAPQPTETATVTVTATTTVPPLATSGNIQIVSIFYNGTIPYTEGDEFVVIRNDDTRAVQVQNWTLRDIQNHIYTFPSFVMQPGQICQVYTNQPHPETCGFNYGFDTAIWNNAGDCGYLRNALGEEIDSYCY
jgi:competence protein ComEC